MAQTSEPIGQPGQQQAMTAERLAEIREWFSGDPSETITDDMGRELLADNGRLHAALAASEAREAAWRDFIGNVASDHEHKWRGEHNDHCKICNAEFSSWSAYMQRQARALLASAGEAAGEQGEG